MVVGLTAPAVIGIKFFLSMRVFYMSVVVCVCPVVEHEAQSVGLTAVCSALPNTAKTKFLHRLVSLESGR